MISMHLEKSFEIDNEIKNNKTFIRSIKIRFGGQKLIKKII